MSESPISCQLHDYLEIACLYRLDVKVTTRGAATHRGTAMTTRTGADKKEYLKIHRVDGEVEIELTRIQRLQALTANPHFEVIDF